MEDLKTNSIVLKAVSWFQTFFAVFLLEAVAGIAEAILKASPENILDVNVWSVAVVGGVLGATIRSAFKKAWQKTMPVKLGGIKRQ